MALTLALLEGVLLFAVGCSMIIFWSHAALAGWLNIATLILKGFAFSLCCMVSFYYNDLYDLRIVRNLRDVASRLLQAFGVAFIMGLAFGFIYLSTRTFAGIGIVWGFHLAYNAALLFG